MRVATQARLAGSVARICASLAGERLRPPPPATDPAHAPPAVERLTTAWLSGALCRGRPGAEVTSFELGAGSDGTSSRHALTVHYNDAGVAAGLPVHVFTESTPRLTSRILLGATGVAAAEALFYSSIRPHLDIGSPAGYHAVHDGRTGRSLILMEDVAKSRGATFGNAAIHVDRAGAESMVREMARYHGAMWEDPRLDREWTTLRDAESWQRAYTAQTRFDLGAVHGFRRAGDVIPAELRPRRRDIWPAAMRSLALNVRGPRTLLHQDTHPGNWCRVPDGRMHLYDWQGVAKGGWALDYSYALSAGLEVENRRAWERELLELYLEELAGAGGALLPFDRAWLAYRQQMFHGFIFWLYTIGMHAISVELQPEDHCRLIIGRIAQAIVDLGSIPSLDERTSAH